MASTNNPFMKSMLNPLMGDRNRMPTIKRDENGNAIQTRQKTGALAMASAAAGKPTTYEVSVQPPGPQNTQEYFRQAMTRAWANRIRAKQTSAVKPTTTTNY